MNPGTVTHLHLLINHVPTVGTVIGLGLFLLSLVRSNDDLKRASLEVLFIVSLGAFVAYLTGVAAQSAVQDRAGVSKSAIEMHQNAALVAFVFIEMTGLLAWLGLWQSRRASRPARWTSGAVLLLSVVTVVLMARAATIGGHIRHPEIRFDQESTAGEGSEPAWLTTASVQEFVVGNNWVWPTCETLHFIGLSLLFGMLTIVNLRLLGLIDGVSFAEIHRLLPWAMVGLGINLVTGMLFFIGNPDQYVANRAFHWKVALLVLGGVNLLCMTVYGKAWALQAQDDPPLAVKAIAASSILLWVGAMYCGRMLPFVGAGTNF